MARWQAATGGVVAFGALVVGLVAPAAAQGTWSGGFTSWSPGAESRRWTDNQTDSTQDRATFADCSRNEGTMALYRSDAGPDTQVGKEQVQCASYADSVISTNRLKGTYHFTYKDGPYLSGKVKVTY